MSGQIRGALHTEIVKRIAPDYEQSDLSKIAEVVLVLANPDKVVKAEDGSLWADANMYYRDKDHVPVLGCKVMVCIPFGKRLRSSARL